MRRKNVSTQRFGATWYTIECEVVFGSSTTSRENMTFPKNTSVQSVAVLVCFNASVVCCYKSSTVKVWDEIIDYAGIVPLQDRKIGTNH